MNEGGSTASPIVAELEGSGWRPLETDGFVNHVGPFWLRTDDGTARVGFIADDRHRNRGGNVQGGMIATLADRAMGQTARMTHGNQAQVTIQLDLHYIDAARIGDFIEARCRVMKQARHIAFIEAEIYSSGRLAATARGIWKMTRSAGRDE